MLAVAVVAAAAGLSVSRMGSILTMGVRWGGPVGAARWRAQGLSVTGAKTSSSQIVLPVIRGSEIYRVYGFRLPLTLNGSEILHADLGC